MPKVSTERKSPGQVPAQGEDRPQAPPEESAAATAQADANGQAEAGAANAGWFRKGNKFWRKRSSHGPKPKFLDPEALAAACEEYLDWADDALLEEPRPYAYAGSVNVRYIPRLRAMTIEGLCVFLDIASTTWGRYRVSPEFADVCARVENIIRTQKFEGAAANIFNARIISRDLRLGAWAREAEPPEPQVDHEQLAHKLAEAIAAAEEDRDP